MSANDTQVAGDHYRSRGKEIQHWDLVTMFQWDYFQSQITKYVMRWKFKHKTHAERLNDLKKARHFLDKYIEEAEKFDNVEEDPVPQEVLTFAEKEARTRAFEDLLGIPAFRNSMRETAPGYWACCYCGSTVTAQDAPGALQEHGECPRGPGYVQQG